MKDRTTMNRFLKVTEMCHLLVSQYLKPGQTAVDATAGNGHDTLFLARTVGPQGRVYAFDIQEQALQNTEALLEANGCRENVSLILDSHANLAGYIEEPIHCLLYNLGYLPGGDKSLITKAATTKASLEQGLRLLAPGGIIAIVAYTGHPGGREESSLVEELLARLPHSQWQVFSWRRENGTAQVPFLLVAYREDLGERRSGFENPTAKKDSGDY